MVTRFGLIGTGYWATTVHGPGLHRHPDVDLVGVWGRDPGRTAAAAAAVGTTPFDEVDALVDAVDAVAFAVAPDVQADLATRAAERGRHLLLDKPLALDVDAACRVAGAVHRAGVASVVFFTRRFSPRLAPWWADVGAGDWSAATVVELSSALGAGSPYASSAWRQERGALWDIGPHALATLAVALGPVDGVGATRSGDGIVALGLTHRGGGASSLLLALDAPEEGRRSSSVLSGRSGVLEMPPDASTTLDSFGRAVDELLAAARAGGGDHPCGAAFGLEVVEVLARAEASIAAPV